LAHAVSAPDKSQTHAINLGFEKATGDIMAYLNSDDMLLPGSLHYVARFFQENPDVDAVYGHRIIVDEHDMEIGRWVLPPHEDDVLEFVDFIPQETLFWRRHIWEKVGPFDETFQFAMDWDYILRMIDGQARLVRVPRFLGAFRIHDAQKTTALLETLGNEEMQRIRQQRHSQKLTYEELMVHIKPYLKRHIFYHQLHRLRILNH